MGILLIGLQVIQYKTLIYDLPLELYGVLLIVTGIAIGSWIASRTLRVLNSPVSRVIMDQGVLSKRELEVLVKMADGNSNQQIADQLFVSLNTVKTHVSSIYLKLHAKRRTQAIDKARKMGIISYSEENHTFG